MKTMIFQIVICIVALLSLNKTMAQPSVKGKLLYHNYSGYDNWDSELFVLNFSDSTVTNISEGWNVDHEMNGMFSPDGTMIVFMGDKANDGVRNWDIFLWTIGENQPVNLTNGGGRDEDPKFSPDGNRIVFKSDRDIKEMDLDGNIINNITNTPGIEESMPYYSTDGQSVVFMAGDGANSRIEMMNRNGSGRHVQVDVENVLEYYPIVRDANSFFYTSWASSVNLNDQLYLKYLNNSKPVLLPFNQSTSNYSDATPVDKDYICLSSTRGGKGGYDLFISEINTGEIWSLDEYNASVNSAKEDLGAFFLADPETVTLGNTKFESSGSILEVYPNPASERIKISARSTNGFNQIKLVSLAGQVLATYQVRNNDYLDIRNIQKGIYILQVNDDCVRLSVN